MAKPRGFNRGFGSGFGVGKYYYGLQQFIWDESAGSGSGFWRLPSSVVGAIDLRPVPAQAIAGGTPQGFAFVASMQPIDVLVSRSLHFGQELTTTAMRDAWEAELGYRPEGATLLDLLNDMLTVGADPTGDVACKPLMPTIDLNYEIWMGGHSRVMSYDFNPETPAGRKTLDILRREYRQLRRDSQDGKHRDKQGQVNEQHYRKVLGYWVRKYGLNYRAFQPTDVPDEEPLDPETTITETWPTNSTTLSSGQDNAWTEVTSNAEVSGNQLRVVTNVTSPVVRCDVDLSGSDNYAQGQHLLPGLSTTRGAGMICRMSSSADTGYWALQIGGDSNNGTFRPYKRVAGTPTALGSGTNQAQAATKKIAANGSTITVYQNGSSVESITDSAISSGTRIGIAFQISVTTLHNYDNIEGGDLGAGTFTGTSAVSVAPTTLSASGSFPFIGTAAVQQGPTTLSGTATFPFIGTAALQQGPTVLSGEAIHTPPTYDSTATVSSGPTALSASSTFTAPTYDGTSSIVFGATTFTGEAAHTTPTYNGTSTISVAPVILEAAGIFTNEYLASASILVPGATTSLAGTFTAPTYAASGVLTSGVTTLNGAASHTTPTYTGTASLQQGSHTFSGSATFTPPVYDSSGSLLVGSATVTSSATHSPPVFTASTSVQAGATIASVSAEFTNPIYEGLVAVVAGTTNLSGTATHSAPIFTGSGLFSASPALFTGIASFTAPGQNDGIFIVGAAFTGGVAKFIETQTRARRRILVAAVQPRVLVDK